MFLVTLELDEPWLGFVSPSDSIGKDAWELLRKSIESSVHDPTILPRYTRGVNVHEFVLASGLDNVPEVKVLFRIIEKVVVEEVYLVKLKSFGLMAGEEGDGALLSEEMLGIADGLTEGVAMFGEDTHAVGEIGGGLGTGGKFGFTPCFDVD